MSSRIVGIYKITSPTGKIYIGQSINCEWRRYLYSVLSCKNQPRIYASLNKHGWDSHSFEIIHTCKIEDLNKWEAYYIKHFDCFDTERGLNLRAGGDQRVGPMAESSKQKISQNKKGVKLSEDAIKKIRLAHQKSDKYRLKFKKVYQFDLDGNLINSFINKTEAEKQTGVPRSSIKDCCLGNQPTCYGFYWSYSENFTPPPKEIIKCHECGTEILKTQHNKRFCSHSCWKTYYFKIPGNLEKEKERCRIKTKKYRDKKIN